jgi:hypothetical protein
MSCGSDECVEWRSFPFVETGVTPTGRRPTIRSIAQAAGDQPDFLGVFQSVNDQRARGIRCGHRAARRSKPSVHEHLKEKLLVGPVLEGIARSVRQGHVGSKDLKSLACDVNFWSGRCLKALHAR